MTQKVCGHARRFYWPQLFICCRSVVVEQLLNYRYSRNRPMRPCLSAQNIEMSSFITAQVGYRWKGNREGIVNIYTLLDLRSPSI